MDTSLPDQPISPLASAVGWRIRQRRQELGMTQAALAMRVSPDLRARDIDGLESGRIRVPCWPLLAQLSQALVLPIEVLLHGVTESARDADAVSSEPTA